MKIMCSVCKYSGEDRDMHLYQSKVLPTARYIACSHCRVAGLEPRPLVVLGSIEINDGTKEVVMNAIKNRLYIGPEIAATEILP